MTDADTRGAARMPEGDPTAGTPGNGIGRQTVPGAGEPVLRVVDLETVFHTPGGVVRAVNGISYSLALGEALAIVGESGSGKTVGVLSLMGLVPDPPGRIENGQVFLNGRNVLDLSSRQWQDVRGQEIAMIFQDPMTSLNPVLTIGHQLAEGVRRHKGLSKRDALARAQDLMELVGIPDAGERLSDYPHQFSGGQRQRIMIAMALSCSPSVLLADEPTTALDVTIQAQIVELVQDLRAKLGMAIVWITHDLALVAGLVDRVAVMYAGFIVEMADVDALYRQPLHPYTLGLMQSMPRLDQPVQEHLPSIEGLPPDLRQAFDACPFEPRCAFAIDRCRSERPPLLDAGSGRQSACWRWQDLAEGAEKAGPVEGGS